MSARSWRSRPRSRCSPPAAMAAAAALFASPLAEGDARAEELGPPEEELPAPPTPRPLVLPDLSHAQMDLALDWLLARAQGGAGASTLAVVRVGAEGDVLLARRLFAGFTLPVAGAVAPAAAGRQTVIGNLEPHVRVAFPMPTSLAFGAVLGVTVPTARYDRNGPAEAAALGAASLEPTEQLQFIPGVVALRPAFDMRLVRGPFVLQAREGLDVAIDSAGQRSVVTYGRLLGHIGVVVGRDVELSLEATQLYAFDPDALERRRSSATGELGVRMALPGRLDLGAALVTNLGTPLAPWIDSFWGLRVSLVAHVDR